MNLGTRSSDARKVAEFTLDRERTLEHLSAIDEALDRVRAHLAKYGETTEMRDYETKLLARRAEHRERVDVLDVAIRVFRDAAFGAAPPIN